MAWELKVEFNDTLCCKLYSRLSFDEEDDELTAPPSSPVENFKYPPLMKFRKFNSSTSVSDVIDNLSSQNDARFPILNSTESVSCKTSFMDAKGMNDVARAQPPLPLRYIKRCNKEKLGSMEDSHVTKSYSEGSIFLKDSIDDVNEGEKLKISENKPGKHVSKNSKTRMYVWKPGKTVNSRVSLNLLRKSCEGSSSRNKSEEFSGSNIVDRNGKGCTDLHASLYTFYKPSEGISERTLTKTDKIQSIPEKSVPFAEEKDVVSEIWRHALLANRSSNSSHSNYSISRDNETDCSRYVTEKHSFLRKGNVLRNYNYTMRSIKFSKDLNYTHLKGKSSTKKFQTLVAQ